MADVHGLRLETAHIRDLERLARRHHLELHALFDMALLHADMRDDAFIGVKIRVKDQSLQRCLLIPLRRRNVVHDGLEDIGDADARLARAKHGVRRIKADDVFNLPLRALRIRARQVDLVDDRDDLEIVLQRHVDVR